MTFGELILKNLHRGRSRTLLTVAGMALAVGAVSMLLSIAWNFAGSAGDLYASRQVDLVVVRAGVAERINSSLSSTIGKRLPTLSGIAEVDGILTQMVSLGSKTMVGVPLRGMNPSGFSMASLEIVAGRKLNATDRRCLLLGVGLARALSARIGQTLNIEGAPFYVVGTFQTSVALESNVAVALLSDVQQLMDRAGRVSELYIRASQQAANEAGIRQLCHDIESLKDDLGQPLGLKALPSRHFAESDTESRLATAMAWGTSVIALALSLVGMMNTILMSVLERRRELSILRALGWSRRRILRMIVGESIIVSLLGAVLGATVAFGLVHVLSQWPRTLNLVPANPSLLAIAASVVLAVASGIAGASYPALWATSIDPAAALRSE